MTRSTKPDGSDCKGTRIPCQTTEGGDHFVCYEPEIVLGMFILSRPKPKGRKRVYLTCPLGHSHSYWVEE